MFFSSSALSLPFYSLLRNSHFLYSFHDMKNIYIKSLHWLRKPQVLILFLLLALPFVGRAQSITLIAEDPNQNPGANSTSNPQYFGPTPVGSSSASKRYTISAGGLDPDTEVIIPIPTRFAGSTDNITFSTANIVLMTNEAGTLAATSIYLRFVPNATGSIVRTLIANTTDPSGEIIYSSPGISLKGEGTPGSPTITTNPSALGFGNQVVGSTSVAQAITVNATSLGTTPITVTAPNGFLVSYNGSPYASSASITPAANGSVTSKIVNVVFAPTAVQNYIGTVTFVSSTASSSVSVSGSGVLPTPILTVSPTSLAFGTTTVGLATASQSFNVSGSNIQGSVTITAPTGFQIRTGSNFFSSSPITLTAAPDGTLASTAISVRFVPTTGGPYNTNVVVSTPNSGSSVVQNVSVTGTANPSSGIPALTVTPSTINFGTVTSSGSAANQTFEVSGTDLTDNVVLTPTSNNIQFRNASAGGSFSNSPLTLTPSNGTLAAQVIEVRLVPTVGGGAFNQQINVVSGSASTAVTITAQNTSGKTSDISVVNPDNNNFTFAARPGFISASQSFLVSGTNLIQPLVIEAIGPNANYFQVSSDNETFVSSISFTPDASGNVIQRPVYVRFDPGTNAVTVTGTIRNSSAPAPNFDVSVTGISEPTIRLDRPIGSFANNVVKNTVTAPVPVRLEGFLLTGDVEFRFPPDGADATRNPLQIPLFEFSLDNGVTYVKSATITPDAAGNFARDLLVRYAPVRVGNAAQELLFRNASFGGAFFPLTSGFGRTTGFSIAVEPTTQSTARVVRSADRISATITFDLPALQEGESHGQNRLVIGSSTYIATLPVRLFPQDKQNFNPGTTDGSGNYNYGSGTPTEKSTDTYVVFSGANNTFTVTNLNPALDYSFFGFEFSNDGVLNAENYLTPNNQPQFPLPVELVKFTATRQTGGGVRLTWATASEKNNDRFEVQRSLDGQTFTSVLSVAGQGTTSQAHEYSALDTAAPTSQLYYRLRQVDLDGKASYSPVASVAPVTGTNAPIELTVYPNPVQDHLTVVLSRTDAAQIAIRDLTGRMVMPLAPLAANGEVNLPSSLAPGTYLLEVHQGSEKAVRRIIKK